MQMKKRTGVGLAALGCIALACAVLLPLIKAAPTVAQEQTKINAFAENSFAVEVPAGTQANSVALPQSLKATVAVPAEAQGEAASEAQEDNAGQPVVQEPVWVTEERDIPVTWECAYYNPDAAGTYTFTLVLPAGHSFEGALPTATVTVLPAQFLAAAAASGEENADVSSSEADTSASEAESSAAKTESGNSESQIASSSDTESKAEEAVPGTIVSFGEYTAEYEVLKGTEIAALELPKTLTAVDVENKELTLEVTWSCENYDGNASGTYTFIAKLPEANPLKEGVAAPQLTVTVLSESKTVAYFMGGEPGNKQSFMLLCIRDDTPLPATLGVCLSDGSYTDVPVTWTRSGSAYGMALEGGYTYDGSLPYAQVVAG